MKTIVGLGNPGEKYVGTRHNVGWLVLDQLKQAISNDEFLISNSPQFQMHKKLQAEVCKVGGLVLVKPMTFMNKSGVAVRKVVEYYQKLEARSQNLEFENLYVVHDDLDIELGEYKIQFGTGPKVHNGVDSVEQHLGTEAFWRVRVGVDNRQGDRSMPGRAYVLQRFSEKEREMVDEVVAEVVNELTQKLKAKS